MRYQPSFALRAAAAAALLLAAACSDQLTTPDGAAPSAPRASVDAATGRPVLHPNRTRYRYHGQRPATGRSGSAQLTMQALLGRDGVTEVALSTGQLDLPWDWAPGSITRAQVKATTPEGRHLFTRNHNDLPGGGTASVEVRGVGRGAVLEVQGNVTGVDSSRTGVVTIAGTVYRRPNLAVTEISAPSRVRSGGGPVNVSATIRETNGDVGSWGTCQLYVNGQESDWAQWIWVDAGDAVTCAFTHYFRGEGPQQVEVRVATSPYAPRDDDPADNTASVTVESVFSNEMFYVASASHITERDSVERYELRRSGAFGEERIDRWTDFSDRQEAGMNAWFSKGLSGGPIRVEIDESTGGATIVSAVYELAPGYVRDDGGFCTTSWDNGSRGYLYVCSDPWNGGSTSLTYRRYAGTAIYHSYFYSRTWNELTGDEYVYSYNNSMVSEEVLAPYGADFAMRVRLHADGQVFTADPAFPFTVHEGRFDWPVSCYSWEEPSWSYFFQQCSGGSRYQRQVIGGAVSDG